MNRPAETLISHVPTEERRWPTLYSLLGHVLLLALVFLGTNLIQPRLIQIGDGGSPGSSDIITVALAEDTSGGAGMYKPSIVPQPEAFPVPPRPQPEPTPTAAPPEETVFEQVRRPAPRKPKPKVAGPDKIVAHPSAGVIPQPPRPGSGGRPSRPSAGRATAGQSGVSIGPGGRSGSIDSWYVKQVEQRVGRNWLKASLGNLARRVRTIVTFDVAINGRINNVRILESSGVRLVDLAAERAVLASGPLPPLPLELRRRTVRFKALFEYPPQ